VDSNLKTLQQLMVISAEECGELTQVCMKYMRRFETVDEITKEMKTTLIEEAGDVLCMIELMVEHKLLTDEDLDRRVSEKRAKLGKWSNLIK
jgi:NTP pyrophosphatase (non-canonical NTP hydrolase)